MLKENKRLLTGKRKDSKDWEDKGKSLKKSLHKNSLSQYTQKEIIKNPGLISEDQEHQFSEKGKYLLLQSFLYRKRTKILQEFLRLLKENT